MIKMASVSINNCNNTIIFIPFMTVVSDDDFFLGTSSAPAIESPSLWEELQRAKTEVYCAKDLKDVSEEGKVSQKRHKLFMHIEQ